MERPFGSDTDIASFARFIIDSFVKAKPASAIANRATLAFESGRMQHADDAGHMGCWMCDVLEPCDGQPLPRMRRRL